MNDLRKAPGESPAGRLRRLTAIFALLWVAATAAAQSVAPLVLAPVRFNDNADGPASDVRVAASSRQSLVVGWIVPEGVQAGIHLRWRVNYLIEPTMRLATDPAAAPRDLTMKIDSRGRLHVVWTALANDRRSLFYARIDQSGQPATSPQLLSQPTTATASVAGGDCEFPVMAADPRGGLLIAWQQSRGARYSIRAVVIGPDGTVADRGAVSGLSSSGLNPQILTTDPARVAWYEVGETASSVRINQWHPEDGRWRPSAWERQARLFDIYGQVELQATADGRGLIGCWRQQGDDGREMLVAGRFKQVDGLEAPPLDVEVFDQPAGVHSSPSMTEEALVWRCFADGRQSILASPMFAGENAAAPLTLSQAGQRFAALPDQATLDRWSAISWLDDARDGGTGNVFLSEIIWPAVP